MIDKAMNKTYTASERAKSFKYASEQDRECAELAMEALAENLENIAYVGADLLDDVAFARAVLTRYPQLLESFNLHLIACIKLYMRKLSVEVERAIFLFEHDLCVAKNSKVLFSDASNQAFQLGYYVFAHFPFFGASMALVVLYAYTNVSIFWIFGILANYAFMLYLSAIIYVIFIGMIPLAESFGCIIISKYRHEVTTDIMLETPQYPNPLELLKRLDETTEHNVLKKAHSCAT